MLAQRELCPDRPTPRWQVRPLEAAQPGSQAQCEEWSRRFAALRQKARDALDAAMHEAILGCASDSDVDELACLQEQLRGLLQAPGQRLWQASFRLRCPGQAEETPMQQQQQHEQKHQQLQRQLQEQLQLQLQQQQQQQLQQQEWCQERCMLREELVFAMEAQQADRNELLRAAEAHQELLAERRVLREELVHTVDFQRSTFEAELAAERASAEHRSRRLEEDVRRCEQDAERWRQELAVASATCTSQRLEEEWQVEAMRRECRSLEEASMEATRRYKTREAELHAAWSRSEERLSEVLAAQGGQQWDIQKTELPAAARLVRANHLARSATEVPACRQVAAVLDFDGAPYLGVLDRQRSLSSVAKGKVAVGPGASRRRQGAWT